MAAYSLKPSASLKPNRTSQGGRAWLTAMGESSVILSAIVQVIHPELYTMGRKAIDIMLTMHDLQDVSALWISIFNGVQVISNRQSPFHRDNQSSVEWYDLLATIGPYKLAIFELPGVGLRFRYNSGTIIGLSGRLLRHRVSNADGDRICLAYYMRENVQRRLGTQPATWNARDTNYMR
jgi:hypothetical protein